MRQPSLNLHCEFRWPSSAQPSVLPGAGQNYWKLAAAACLVWLRAVCNYVPLLPCPSLSQGTPVELWLPLPLPCCPSGPGVTAAAARAGAAMRRTAYVTVAQAGGESAEEAHCMMKSLQAWRLLHHPDGLPVQTPLPSSLLLCVYTNRHDASKSPP